MRKFNQYCHPKVPMKTFRLHFPKRLHMSKLALSFPRIDYMKTFTPHFPTRVPMKTFRLHFPKRLHMSKLDLSFLRIDCMRKFPPHFPKRVHIKTFPPHFPKRVHTRKFDLQFFAEERTEEATPHKREKVREEGRVCMSKDLNAAVGIITALLGLAMLGAMTWRTLTGLIQFMIRAMGDQTILRDGWFAFVSWEAIKRYFAAWLPLGGLVVLFSTAAVIAQVGFAITGEPFGPKFDRLNPFTGMKKIISLRSCVELLKGLLKASIFAVMIYTAIRSYLPVSSKTLQMPLNIGAGQFWDMLWSLAMRLALMLLVMAFADYAYQKWDFEKSIRMSKKEVKDEYKQMEGDPQVKQKIRQKQREMAKQRMMADVPKSDVVITNPTHIAVALQYDRKVMQAPVVIAKGGDYLAQRIREIAKANLSPVVENKPLAWMLYENVEIGEEIPEDMYKAVAEVLAFVYKLKAS